MHLYGSRLSTRPKNVCNTCVAGGHLDRIRIRRDRAVRGSFPEIGDVTSRAGGRVDVVKARTSVRPGIKIVEQAVKPLRSIDANVSLQVNDTPKLVRSGPLDGVEPHLQRDGSSAQGKVGAPGEYVPEDGRGEAIGIGCGKEDPIPNVGIRFTEIKR